VLLLLAVHIADNVLTWPWVAGGFGLAAVLALLGAWRIRDEEIPQVALLTAAFFVASLIHVPMPPTSVHLLLNGLVGIVLGRRAALAIPLGLFLQAALVGHGGFTTLGVNSCVMTLPALLGWQLCNGLQRVPWVGRPWFRALLVAVSSLAWILSLVCGLALLIPAIGPVGAILLHPVTLALACALVVLAVWIERRLENAPEFPVGVLIGEVVVLATTALNALVLAWGGQEDWSTLARLVFLAHLPVAALEGIVLGFTVPFLVRVKPELLGWTLRAEAECPVESLP
jgi:ABC-type Co2+ transport system permease subunit